MALWWASFAHCMPSLAFLRWVTWCDIISFDEILLRSCNLSYDYCIPSRWRGWWQWYVTRLFLSRYKRHRALHKYIHTDIHQLNTQFSWSHMLTTDAKGQAVSSMSMTDTDMNGGFHMQRITCKDHMPRSYAKRERKTKREGAREREDWLDGFDGQHHTPLSYHTYRERKEAWMWSMPLANDWPDDESMTDRRELRTKHVMDDLYWPWVVSYSRHWLLGTPPSLTTPLQQSTYTYHTPNHISPRLCNTPHPQDRAQTVSTQGWTTCLWSRKTHMKEKIEKKRQTEIHT